MHNLRLPRLPRIAALTALSLLVAPVVAADQYIVRVPANVSAPVVAPGDSTPPASSIKVLLEASALTTASVGEYYAFDFRPLLSIEGTSGGYVLEEVSWSLAHGSSLPEGLSLRSNGMISGTPTTAGTHEVTLKATYRDASGAQTYQLVSANITVSLQSVALPYGMLNKTYPGFDFKTVFQAEGDLAFDPAQARFTLRNGSVLPAGLSLTEDGLLQGTPTSKTEGSDIEVQAAYKGKSAIGNYNVAINGLALEARRVAVGKYHACAITPAGGAVCWGNNANGQLGNGTLTESLKPVQVTGLESGVTDISVGNAHTCAIQSGAAKCWGYGGNGVLGNSASTRSTTPVAVTGLTSGVTKIKSGLMHNCAIQAGAAKCWGDNKSGQLGDGTELDRNAPVQVSGLESSVSDISAGEDFSCAIQSGSAKCWGRDDYGQIGAGTKTPYGPNKTTPQQVVGITSGAVSIDGRAKSGCTALSDGKVYCWGMNNGYQVGDTTTTTRISPVYAQDSANIVRVVTGYPQCGLTASDGLMCWGNESNGSLGGIGVQRKPFPMPGLDSGIEDVSAFESALCFIRHGIVKCMGTNTYGQLGDGTKTHRSSPTDVLPQ